MILLMAITLFGVVIGQTNLWFEENKQLQLAIAYIDEIFLLMFYHPILSRLCDFI